MEITLLKLKMNGKTIFKATKRVPELNVSETMMFERFKEAEKQIKEWLSSFPEED